MSDLHSAHDNIDVRVNSKINFYGPVMMIGSVSISGVSLLFLGVWMATHWAAAVLLSAILVYGMVGMLGLVAALWIRFVIHPVVEARVRNRLLHVGENGVVIAQMDGALEMVPLIQQREVRNIKMVEAPEKEEPQVNENVILELYDKGHSLRSIAESVGATYYPVQRIYHEAKQKGTID